MHYFKYFSFYLILLVLVVIISCEKKDDSVIDPILNYPLLDTVYLNSNIVDSNYINIIAYAKVTSIDPVEIVIVNVFEVDNNSEGQFILKDDGIAPDLNSGDGLFTGYITINMDCRLVGQHTVKFVAKTKAGLSSPELQDEFEVRNSFNQIPIVSNLSITPDSARYGDTATFVFRINAFDPDGFCDIKEVFYTGFNPSGGALTRQFLFRENGSNIIYSRTFRGSPAELGYYKYYLRAVDRSQDTSNILSDSIYVYQ